MSKITHIKLHSPSGAELKSARFTAGLSQVEAATLMGYPVQAGSRGGMQSRTWQALESPGDERTMPGPVFALFLLLTQQHPDYALTPLVNNTEHISALVL
jgi:hypothetical protein